MFLHKHHNVLYKSCIFMIIIKPLQHILIQLMVFDIKKIMSWFSQTFIPPLPNTSVSEANICLGPEMLAPVKTWNKACSIILKRCEEKNGLMTKAGDRKVLLRWLVSISRQKIWHTCNKMKSKHMSTTQQHKQQTINQWHIMQASQIFNIFRMLCWESRFLLKPALLDLW